MTAGHSTGLAWRDGLPDVRGRLEFDADIAKVTWFRTGGPADVAFRPADEEDLSAFLSCLDPSISVTVLGIGSNLLIRDGGIRGVVIRLGRGFSDLHVAGTDIIAGAAAPDRNVALAAAKAGIAGLAFLTGIPGTIGGALRMNAGAYGREMKDILVTARAVDRNGQVHEAAAGDLGLTYRHSSAPADWIFTRATLSGEPGEAAEIRAAMEEIDRTRAQAQPLKTRTGGSTFKNPPGEKAWQLIDRAGCRGLRIGDAQVSEKHCNFLLNTGHASAADIESLGEEVRRRVRETTGHSLEWEIKRLGEPAMKEMS
ncbi:MAG: UDP-N-acetylmuramate dehydrogenase [Rhodospirillales bacterium]